MPPDSNAVLTINLPYRTESSQLTNATISLGRDVEAIDTGLFEEAIRFYNFASTPVTKHSWSILKDTELVTALPELRLEMHDRLYKLIGNLVDRTKLQKVVLKDKWPGKKSKELAEAVVGRYIMKVLTDDTWREKANRKTVKAPPLRYFEKLDEITNRLYNKVSAQKLVDALRANFGYTVQDGILGPLYDFTPVSIAANQAGVINAYRQFFGPKLDWKKIGLTEKLYRGLAGSWFAKEQVILRKGGDAKTWTKFISKSNASAKFSFAIVDSIRKDVDEIKTDVFPPSLKKACNYWDKVYDGLDALESPFLGALADEKTSVQAKQLGFPWALVLVALLRAYVTSIMAHLMVLSLPLKKLHWEADSHVAVALWESVNGLDAPSVSVPGYYLSNLGRIDLSSGTESYDPGCLVGDTDRKQRTLQLGACEAKGKLASWGTMSFAKIWSLPGSSLNHVVAEQFKQMAENPVPDAVLLNKAIQELLAAKDAKKIVDHRQVGYTYDKVLHSWHRYPLGINIPTIRYRRSVRDKDKVTCLAKVKARDLVDVRLQFGAYYTAQAYLYVASAILGVAIDDLGLSVPSYWDEMVECPQCAHFRIERPDDKGRKERCDQGELTKLHSIDDHGIPPMDDSCNFTDLPSDAEIAIWNTPAGQASPQYGGWLERYKKWKKMRENPCNDTQTNSRKDGAMMLVAGCFPWGGRKQPHKTHKDGSTYDLKFGADTPNWPISASARIIKLRLPLVWDQIIKTLARLGIHKDKEIKLKELASKDFTLPKKIVRLKDALEEYDRLCRIIGPLGYVMPITDLERRVILQGINVAHFKKADKREEKDKVLLANGLRFLQINDALRRFTLGALSDPMRVRLKGNDTDMRAIRGHRIFRSFVRDLLERMQREMAFLIFKSPESIAVDENGKYEEIEEQLSGTPFPQSTLGIQQTTIGHIAIILSGAKQIIYSSPITHFRAINAIRCGLSSADAQEELKYASQRIIPAVEFAFFPQDHHHHWHVEYRDPGRETLDSRTGMDPIEAKEEALKRFKEHLNSFWFRLGIDMKPFLEYLKQQSENMELGGNEQSNPNNVSDPQLMRSVFEKRDLILMLTEYQEKFEKEYLHDAAGYVRLMRARHKLHHIFMNFSDINRPLMQTALPVGKPSPQIQKLMDIADKIIQKSLIRAIRDQMPKIVREKMKREGWYDNLVPGLCLDPSSAEDVADEIVNTNIASLDKLDAEGEPAEYIAEHLDLFGHAECETEEEIEKELEETSE